MAPVFAHPTTRATKARNEASSPSSTLLMGAPVAERARRSRCASRWSRRIGAAIPGSRKLHRVKDRLVVGDERLVDEPRAAPVLSAERGDSIGRVPIDSRLWNSAQGHRFLMLAS